MYQIQLIKYLILSSFIGASITFILLSKYALLSPTSTPRAKQVVPLEWQKYDTVKLVDHFNNNQNSSNNNGNNNDDDDNDEFDDKPLMEAPLDVWNPILPHKFPINDITIQRCSIPPSLELYMGSCYPKSSIEDDAKYGPWVRVGLNLNIQQGKYWNYVYYRRSRRLDISYIDDVKLLEDGMENELIGDDKSWYRVNIDIRQGLNPSQNPAYLWYHIKPANQGKVLSNEVQNNAITEFDILFGDGPPWPDFKRIAGVNVQDKSDNRNAMTLTVRKGYRHPKQPEELKFKPDGSFRILQIADLHFSVGDGHCRDTLKPNCTGDIDTINLMSETLDDIKPDFVAFTGDQLNGQGSSFDAVSVTAKAFHQVVKRKIPFTAIFGNHDSELTDLPRSEQMRIIQALPFSLADSGPRDVSGVGNHVLKIYAPDQSKSHLFTMYFLDSHALLPPPMWNPFKDMRGKYDYIKQDQIDWFLDQSNQIELLPRPFIPLSKGEDGTIYNDNVNSDINDVNQTPMKANGMVFAHIPLREYYDSDPDLDENAKPIEGWGSRIDMDGASQINSGFFNTANTRLRNGLNAVNEIKVIAHGHCHVTDDCKLIEGTWICFGGGSSYSGYSVQGFDKRFRVYDLLEWGETIETFKRTENGEYIDKVILVN